MNRRNGPRCPWAWTPRVVLALLVPVLAATASAQPQSNPAGRPAPAAPGTLQTTPIQGGQAPATPTKRPLVAPAKPDEVKGTYTLNGTKRTISRGEFFR